MEPGTGLLEVPYDEVLQARMALASEGFPRSGGGVGFESLYQEQQMGLSSFMEQARYHRAVEAEACPYHFQPWTRSQGLGCT